MATLIARISDDMLRQYDETNQTVIYENGDSKLYGSLTPNGNCVFICPNFILVGEYQSETVNQNIQFHNIRKLNITNKDLLRLSAYKPEENSRTKASFYGYVQTSHIDISLLEQECNGQQFITYNIVKANALPQAINELNENDRVITIDSDNRLIDLFSVQNGSLTLLNLGGEYFNARGRTLDQILHIIERVKEDNSNLGKCVNRIKVTLETANSFVFGSFSEYYNIIHNKRLFSNTPSDGGGIEDEENDDPNNIPFNMPLNTILYGPPGTGKTFHSITHAVAIVDDKNPAELIESSKTEAGRKAIKDRYDFLFESGNIAFTTFHQSLSYEDFIEGIKPLEPTPGQTMQYDIVDGIFKMICDKAEKCVSSNITQGSSFEDALEQLEAEWRVNPTMSFELTRDNKSFTITEFKSKNIPFKKASGGTAHSLSKKTLSDLYLGIKKSFPSGLEIYYKSVLDKLKSYTPLVTEGINKSDSKPCKFVLIVDEINRGNVSQIFGELITLLEPDKRIGEMEEIRLMLPYSKEEFGVPLNVYIIGTMNTADRSVEALDTALRRRFSFIPMMPDYSGLSEACDGVNLKLLLQKLNERLTVLKDRDHTIGHAWLWNTTSIDSLRLAFKDKIIPLLQEFFYNDYEKLGLLLGDRFIQTEITVNNNLFAPFERGSGLKNQYANKAIYKITEPSSWNSEAFQSIYL
jgi:5-methylcytosine-specific restriction protein B